MGFSTFTTASGVLMAFTAGAAPTALIGGSSSVVGVVPRW